MNGRYQQPARVRYREAIRVGGGEDRNIGNRGRRTLCAMSLGECAAELGISRQAAHQLERVALRKLRLGLLAAVAEVNPAMHQWLIRTRKEI